MKSIQTRLAGGLIVSLIVFLIVQWLLIGASIRYLSEAYVATRLEHDAQSLLSALDFKTRPASLDTSRVGAIYRQPFSGHYYRVKTGTSDFRSRSLWDTELRMLSLQPGQSKLIQSPGPQNQQLLIYHTVYIAGQDLITIAVAEDLTPILQDIKTFQLRHTEISAAVLAILVLIQAFIVKISLRPLDTVRRDLENLEKGVINQLNDNVPLEIRPLVKELNYQLNAIKKRLQRSRNATGNLAHTLKTPLTLIVQLAQSEAMQSLPAVREKLLQHTQAIQHSIERELKRARMAGGAVSGRQALLLPELTDLHKTLAAMYREKNISVSINVPDKAACPIERQDLLEIFGNVLENAYKWAAKRINVTMESKDGVLVCIEDDGPGIDQSEIKKLIRRGARADEQVVGHGLGLSIVSELVADYNGHMDFARSEDLGGLKVCVHFPIP